MRKTLRIKIVEKVNSKSDVDFRNFSKTVKEFRDIAAFALSAKEKINPEDMKKMQMYLRKMKMLILKFKMRENYFSSENYVKYQDAKQSFILREHVFQTIKENQKKL